MSSLPYPEAMAAVIAKVKASRTSFHRGMAILPKKRRNAMYAVYAFCRVVDDIADDSPSPEVAGRDLQTWRHRLSDAFQNKPSDEITSALIPAIAEFGLVEKDFQQIIDGMEMDAIAIVAPNLETLDLYCDNVASAVGRISVRVFGDEGAAAMDVAHHLGRALQLTNILRDLAEDASRGRLYLPKELLEKHGITSRSPKEILRDPRLTSVCLDLATLAETHYRKADLSMKKCGRRNLRPAWIMRIYYGAIFDKLRQYGWRDPSVRISLSKAEKMFLFLKSLVS